MGLNNFWMGSFHTQNECMDYVKAIGTPMKEVRVTSPEDLPQLTEEEHARHLKRIEMDLKAIKARLLEPLSLAEKLEIKQAVKLLERKRMQFQLHFYTLVPVELAPQTRPTLTVGHSQSTNM